MADSPTLVLHLKDHAGDDRLREHIEQRFQQLAEEFHELTRLEITLTEEGASFSATGDVHVTGKNKHVATHADATEVTPAIDALLAKIERQLRRVHDKRIFAQRREAQRDPPKRKQ